MIIKFLIAVVIYAAVLTYLFWLLHRDKKRGRKRFAANGWRYEQAALQDCSKLLNRCWQQYF